MSLYEIKLYPIINLPQFTFYSSLGSTIKKHGQNESKSQVVMWDVAWRPVLTGILKSRIMFIKLRS